MPTSVDLKSGDSFFCMTPGNQWPERITIHLPSVTPKVWLSRMRIKNFSLTPVLQFVTPGRKVCATYDYSINWLIMKNILTI